MPTTKPKTKAGKQRKMKKVMDEYKSGTLKSGKGGKGGKVKSRKQAIAIGLSESGQSYSDKPARKKATKKKAVKKKATRKR